MLPAPLTSFLANIRRSARAREQTRHCFPAGIGGTHVPRSLDDSISVFRELGDQGAALEDNLLLLVDLKCQDARLCYVSMQVLWADVTISELTASARHQYLRLDYDLSAMGDLLAESQPHVHTRIKGPPRLPVPAAEAEYPIGWFLDFVYRTYCFDEKWLSWAENLWKTDCKMRIRENRWERLRFAFKASQPAVIANSPELSDDLRALKQLLREERKRWCSIPIDRSHIDLFANDLAQSENTI